MTIPSWPTSLPQYLEIDGYDDKEPDVLLRSKMDKGPDKVRLNSTAGIRSISGQMIIDQVQLGVFRNWFRGTIKYGSLRFSWVDPTDNTVATEMRFTETPSTKSIGGLYYRITMSLEILP